MRTRHWLAGLLGGWLALAGGGTSHAQPPMPSNGNPDQVGMGMLPLPYNTAYGPPQQNYAGAKTPGYPPGANPWPNMSPFAGPPVDSTVYQDGFWYNQTKQGSRKYYFSVDAVFGHSSKPSTTLIGAPNVNAQSADQVSGLGAGTSNGTSSALLGATQFNQAPGGGPVRTIGLSGGGGGGNNGGSQGSVVIFGSQDTGALDNTLNGTGVRGTWGWFNNDDTGFTVSGFMQNRSTLSWGLQDPGLVLDPNSQQFNPLLHLHAWFGLPLAGADTDNTAFNGLGTAKDGAVQPYDMGVNVLFSSRLAGANADWYFNPIVEGEKMKLRPLAGAKFVRLQEDFLFDAYDSGMAYTINNASSVSNGGSGATTGTGFLTPLALTTPFNVPNVFHSRLDSATLANMAGPEIGLRLDLGGKKFQFWTQTKVGLLANVTQRQISGFGIGNAFNITTVNGTLNTVPVTPNDPSKTAFSNSQMTTTMSPMFEQQFNVKMPIFNLVPYLNRMEAFERANLTAGYTFMYLQDVYRPQNAILWNQWPQTPQLNSQKSNFYNSMVNIGVEWQY